MTAPEQAVGESPETPAATPAAPIAAPIAEPVEQEQERTPEQQREDAERAYVATAERLARRWHDVTEGAAVRLGDSGDYTQAWADLTEQRRRVLVAAAAAMMMHGVPDDSIAAMGVELVTRAYVDQPYVDQPS